MLPFVQVIAETNAGYKNSGFQCRILNMVCVSVCGQGHISVTKLLTPYLTRRKASFEVALPPSQWRSRWVRWLFHHHSMIRCDFSVVIYHSRRVSWLAGDFSITIHHSMISEYESNACVFSVVINDSDQARPGQNIEGVQTKSGEIG